MAKSDAKKNQLIWEPKKMKVAELKSNPNNPKIVSEIGKKRLKLSMAKFGLAGTIPVNIDGTIIDGHSRKEELIQAGIEEVWVSVPSRPLSDKEYQEMNAMFDVAKASDPDMFMMENIFTDDVMDEWDLHGSGQKKSKIGKKGVDKETGVEPKYPLVPQYDEKHEAIIILCSNTIDTVFIKNALGIGREMSYKNKMVKETSVVTAKKFIELWNKK